MADTSFRLKDNLIVTYYFITLPLWLLGIWRAYQSFPSQDYLSFRAALAQWERSLYFLECEESEYSEESRLDVALRIRTLTWRWSTSLCNNGQQPQRQNVISLILALRNSQLKLIKILSHRDESILKRAKEELPPVWISFAWRKPGYLNTSERRFFSLSFSDADLLREQRFINLMVLLETNQS